MLNVEVDGPGWLELSKLSFKVITEELSPAACELDRLREIKISLSSVTSGSGSRQYKKDEYCCKFSSTAASVELSLGLGIGVSQCGLHSALSSLLLFPVTLHARDSSARVCGTSTFERDTADVTLSLVAATVAVVSRVFCSSRF